jgi:alpha-glucosidase
VLLEPHHDGSLRHVSTDRPGLGDSVEVRVRVPTGIGVDRVHVRTIEDGEPRYLPLRVAGRTPHETWWATSIRAHNPVVSYRFLTDGAAGYGWLTATGWHRRRDVTDGSDYLLSAHPGPPAWVQDAIVHQVFPDRFARSPAANERPVPDWAEPSTWSDPVDRKRGSFAFQFYGGDLDGVVGHLDHLQRLSTDVVYLTPIFPARSAHRYDARSFDHVDPLLGGDAALARLVASAHERGIRVIGDLTTNHTGAGHDWFLRALQDPAAPEASFYYFSEHPHDYVGWMGHRSLPKLDWRSDALRQRFLRGPDSVVGRWLRPPAELDGWRIDVANMTGRFRKIDLAHSVAREIRATMAEVRPDGWLVAEHWHGAGPDLAGDGWHGTMNYASFTRPVWSWLADHRPGALAGGHFLGVPTGYGVPRLSGTEVVRAMREASATMPWRSLVSGMNSLDTHDTPRFITVVGEDPDRYAAGLALMFTLPGAPTVFAGAETGIGAADGELSRFPIPWERPGAWDGRILTLHQQYAEVRRRSVALRHGSLRWLEVSDNVLVFEREAPDASQRVLVQVARGPHPPVVLPGWWFDSTQCLIGGEHPTRLADGTWGLPGGGAGARVWSVA